MAQFDYFVVMSIILLVAKPIKLLWSKPTTLQSSKINLILSSLESHTNIILPNIKDNSSNTKEIPYSEHSSSKSISIWDLIEV